MKIEDLELLKRILEAALMAADQPLAKRGLKELFDDLECPDDELIDEALAELEDDCEGRGYELVRVASGYRFQVRQELGQWVSRLWKERAPRYSRALLETLSLVAYRQPITRGEIEDIRGVAVSTQIIKTLLERDWVKVVGHRDVPGRPAIYATTKQFLDYFNLKSLDQLPTLAEIRELGTISRDFNIELPAELTQPANDDDVELNADSALESEIEAGVHQEVAQVEDEQVDDSPLDVDQVGVDQDEVATELESESVTAFDAWDSVQSSVEAPADEAEFEDEPEARRSTGSDD